MKIEVLGAHGGQRLGSRMTCLLINDTIALDAGCLSQALSVERQNKVKAIVLSHSHMDHTNSLPFFIENVFGRRQATDIYASGATIYAIKKYLFNDATWPDFTRIPNNLMPAINFNQVHAESPFMLEGVKFTPIEMSHLIPTYGFLIQQDGKSFLWSSDTGPTERFWEIANHLQQIDMLCIEVSFDDSLQKLADVSCHLTPRSLSYELRKLKRSVPKYLHHLKPACIEKIEAEIRVLQDPELAYLEQGKIYEI